MCGDKKGLGPGSWVPVGVECPASQGVSLRQATTLKMTYVSGSLAQGEGGSPDCSWCRPVRGYVSMARRRMGAREGGWGAGVRCPEAAKLGFGRVMKVGC